MAILFTNDPHTQEECLKRLGDKLEYDESASKPLLDEISTSIF